MPEAHTFLVPWESFYVIVGSSGAALTGFVALLPAFVGMYAGQRLRRRLNPEVFRRWFFAGLICLGGYMVVRSL